VARRKLGDILVHSGLIDEAQLRAALGDQGNWGQRLGLTLVKMGLLEERDLVRALAQQLELPVVSLEGKRVEPDVVALVPSELAEKHVCVPLFLKEQRGVRILYVGMDDPSNLDAVDELGFRTGCSVRPVLVAPSELNEALDRLYRRRKAPVGIDLDDSRGGQSLELAAPVGGDGATAVEESLFRDLSRSSAFEEPRSAPEPAPDASEAAHRTILRALCQLLIDKRVIGREELQSLVRSIDAGRAS
jgi:hypothetical protein